MRTLRIAPFVGIFLAVVLSACAAPNIDGNGVSDRALQALGLQTPSIPEGLERAPSGAKTTQIPLRMHASETLNVDNRGNSLAVVTRIYKLRTTDAFMQSPYELFQSDTNSKDSAFSKDLIESRELIITPGQKIDSVEKLPEDAVAIGVVVLFRTPAPQRWKFVFEKRAASASGITLGLHGCAISVAQGQPLMSTPEQLRVAGVKCE